MRLTKPKKKKLKNALKKEKEKEGRLQNKIYYCKKKMGKRLGNRERTVKLNEKKISKTILKM